MIDERTRCRLARAMQLQAQSADALNRTGDGDDEIAHVRVPGVNAAGGTYRLSGVRKAGFNSAAGELSRDAAK
jgi:hypothetical protein